MSFDLGQCLDSSMANTVALLGGTTSLFNPDRFINPQAAVILGIVNSGAPLQTQIEASILSYGGIPTNQRADLVLLYNAVTSLVGGNYVASYNPVSHAITHTDFTGIPMMTQYESMTNFFSGKTSIFPVSGINLEIPNMALLGTMTFAGLLGVAKAAPVNDNLLCQLDPDDPCAKVMQIFASVMGAYNAILNAIATGLGTMNDFLNNLAAYALQAQQYLADVVQMIMESIGALVSSLMTALRYGLAKLFNACAVDPCISQVMNVVMGTELKNSLAVPIQPPPI